MAVQRISNVSVIRVSGTTIWPIWVPVSTVSRTDDASSHDLSLMAQQEITTSNG